MTQAIHLKQCQYTFPSGRVVGPLDLHVAAGELVVLAGETGAGKSTFARMIVGLSQRHGHGRVDGTVRLGGLDPGTLSGAARVHAVGFVGQEVDDCVLSGTCAGEVAFALESAGLPPSAVAGALERVGLAGFEDRDPLALSGGERQRLVIAAALAAQPVALVLDEPLSQLDPAGAQEMVELLRCIADQGVAVLVVEHRLSLLGCADRVVWLGEPAELVLPPERSTWNKDEGEVLRVDGVTFLHPGGRGVQDLSFSLTAGERVAIVGGNGAGKSTLLGILSGRLSASTGRIVRAGRVIEVPQNADLVLFSATAAAELRYGPSESGREIDASALLRDFGLAGLDERPPQALSRGQRLRLAVGATLACAPEVLVLDEPGSGQDTQNLHRLFTMADRVAHSVVFSSHDPELVRRWATRVIWLEAGRIREDKPVAASAWRVAPPKAGRSTATPSTLQRVGLDPRLRLLLVLLLGLTVVLLDSAWSLSALALALVVTALVHPAVRPWRRALVFGALAMAWSTALSQSLFWVDWPRTPLFALGPLTFWREGAVNGLAQSTRFIALAAAGLLLAASTPTDRMVTALRSSVFGKKLPVSLVLMVAAMVRFVPLVASEWAEVRGARRARGRPAWQRSPVAWLTLEVNLLRPVVARCIRRARMLAESLDTRGFDADAPRGIANPLAWRRSDSVVLSGALFAVLILTTARTLYGLYAGDVWYYSALRPLYAFVRAWL
jgi:energy-coupling factor transport system ATP-binding protein